MINILSVQNFHDFSWVCSLQSLIQQWATKYHVHQLVKEHRRKVLEWQSQADLVLTENVDSACLVVPKGKAIVRIGGLMSSAAEQITCTRFDTEFLRAGAVISTNNSLANVGLRNNPYTYVIPNGTNLTVFKPLPDKKQANVPFIIGFAGNIGTSRYMDYKGYSYILNAQLQLILDTALKLALYGPLQTPYEEMPRRFYAQIDCLINASKGEGCSNTIVEALASGVPVLCTKVGYHGEMLVDELNCLFIERDADDITAKIKRLMEEPELWYRLSQQGRQFAEDHHDIRKIAEAYDVVFQGVLSRRQQQKKEVDRCPL